MCDKAVRRSHALEYVPDRYNTKEMHKNVARGCRYVLEFVPDWSVTQEMCENMEMHEEKMADDDDDDDDEDYDEDDELVDWCGDYK